MFSALKTAAWTVMEDIILYNNKSFLVPLFFIALLFLWVTEKNKRLRVVLVYLVTALGVVFVCPLYAWIGIKIDAVIYYRVLWALPIGVLVCYSAVRLMMRFQSMVSRGLVFVLTLIVICINGDLVYTKTLHFKSVNAYHMPQQVIDVAEALKLDNYTPIAVMPAELLPFFRQYTADVFTPYGRNILEPAWSFSNALYDAMEGDKTYYDAVEVARCAREEHCAYVVLSCAKQIRGGMEEQNYFLLDFVQGYYIYMDYNYYDVYKEQGLLDEDVIEVGEAKRGGY
ncbi:MAG: hypothetical protein K2N90_10270 [Lachnospiraceae bacterium]|nr:hypothetical protein [Lachnospiraceae bacterium]